MKKILFILSFVLLFTLSGCKKEIVLSFDTNGAGTIESITLDDSIDLEMPTVTKTGYTFDGWYFDSEFTTKYENQEITKSTVFYAKWSAITFEVSFINGEILLQTQIVEYGKSANPPINIEKEGYDFTGWDKSFSNVTSNLEVHATFSIKQYTIQFIDHDGTQIGSDVIVNHGDDVTPPSDPVRPGYKFTGWDKPLENITSEIGIIATYIPEKYSVIFKDHDNTVLKQIDDVEYLSEVTAPTEPTRVGYIFKEWDNSFSEITSNLTVKAIYDPVKYTINYYDNTTLLSHSPEEYTIEDNVNLSTYDKTDHLFVGWYSDSLLTNKIDAISKGTHENITLYGKWLDVNNKNTINYELNGGAWAWNADVVSNPGSGIDGVSNLPELFMMDFYTYLKDNDLLSSSKVASSIRKTNWNSFKANYNDPVAIYNHTSTNTSQSQDGYSQFFYTTATGNTSTSEITTIEGGFFGTEPYKSKYAPIAQLLAYMVPLKYSGNYFWGGESAKALAGFILDGYFYGTQGASTGTFAQLRSLVPNTNKMVKVTSGNASLIDRVYQISEYVVGLEAILAAPFKEGYAFRGWYDNPEFTGDAVMKIEEGVTPKSMYYAKWELID